MTLKKEEEILVEILRNAIKSANYSQGDIDARFQHELGFILAYYLKAILDSQKDSNLEGKWIDFIEWKSLHLLDVALLKGRGILWWGYKTDESKTFSENFYCELQVSESEGKSSVLYSFQFRIGSKNYTLKR